jgi:CRP/FNR family cyclic AMP-dependent transcriptional regulator
MDPLSREAVIELLRCAPMLTDVGREELSVLVPKVQITEHEAGERIFSKGDPADCLMIVVLGRVKITSTSPRGKEFLFNVLSESEIFGELALIDGGRRSADVTTIGRAALLRLYKSDFENFLIDHPLVALQVMRVLCERLRRATQLVEDSVFLDFPSRLARRLMELADDCGEHTEDGFVIEHGLSDQELADSMGAARQSLEQQLAVWQGRGLLKAEHGRVVLRSPGELEAFLDE